MYKDRSSTKARGECPEIKKIEEVPLKDIPMNESKASNLENKEVVTQEANPKTPVTELRRSSRTIRPLQRYSLALHYILFMDQGEPETYKETLQADESTKWELSMKDKMDFLMSNQTWKLAEWQRKTCI